MGVYREDDYPNLFYVDDHLYYGNCIWDALGIPAMLHTAARIECSCGCCGESMRLSVSAGTLAQFDGVFHFAIPASQWWQDIVYT
ncbi:MAG TPA: organomercurial lyase [Blastocatellia bacterium]|nr:organomercurial lyase [Blastocatellia bacterium]